MPRLIIKQEISTSEFEVVDAESASVAANNVILPLEFYLEHRAELQGRNDVGVWLDAGEEIEMIEDFANELPVVALNFPTFADGRAYSSANILRRKYGYQGEVRAVGDVRLDQLSQMYHCGFSAFDMAEGQDLAAALEKLTDFTYNYQATIARPEPLFRQR